MLYLIKAPPPLCSSSVVLIDLIRASKLFTYFPLLSKLVALAIICRNENKINNVLGFLVYVQVSPGSDCTYAQDVAAINLAEKRCCVLGKLDKRAVIDPDVDSLLDAVINLD